MHERVDALRPGADYGYREIVHHDMTGAVPVLLDAADPLVFDSHLMHRSTDSGSDGIRAALLYHCAATGTVERLPNPVNDFPTVRPPDPQCQ